MSDYVENMFSVKEVPWHKKGAILDDPPSTEEAVKLAGCDDEIELCPIDVKKEVFVNGINQVTLLDGGRFRAICRIKDGYPSDVYGIVTSDYKPFQNRDAFRWFDRFIDSGQAVLETAGSLKSGRVVWILARIGKDIEVGMHKSGKQDLVRPYILLNVDHGGKNSIRANFTPVRVVCWNTLSMANSDQAVTVVHRGDVASKIDNVGIDFHAFLTKYHLIGQAYQVMDSVRSEVGQVHEFVERVFPLAKTPASASHEESERIRKHNLRVERKRGAVVENYGGENQTAWGLYNAYTGYIDHDSMVRGGTEGRLYSSWFGTGAKKKTEALSVVGDIFPDVSGRIAPLFEKISVDN